MASLIKKQELIKTYNEQKEILKIKQSAYQTADDVDADNVMDLYDEYHVLKKVVLEMEAQIAEMNEDSVKCVLDGEDPAEKVGGAAEWANDDKSEVTEPVVVVVVPPTPVVVPPTPVVVPHPPVVVPPTPVIVPPTPVVVPPTPVVVPPTPVVVPPTPVDDVDPSKIHYVKSGADFREEYLKMIAAGKTCMVLGEGEYRVNIMHLRHGKYFVLDKPTKISGQGCGKTTLVGFGLLIQEEIGNKSDGIVEIEELTIKGGEKNGLWAYNGMKVIMRGCTVEECQECGVEASGADISCDDVQVIGCGLSGVCAYNATITLSGQGTTIQGNGTVGESYSPSYGLNAFRSSANVHLVAPLTKEQISTNNGGGGNWGGGGTIEQIPGEIEDSSPGETKVI